jgi:hypothetical protein
MKPDLGPPLEGNSELGAGDATSFDLPRAFRAVYLSGVFDHFLNEKQRGRTPHNTVQHLEWGGAWALTSPWV